MRPDIQAKIPVVEGETPAAAARRYEALGRVMAAFAGEAELLETCRDLTWWRGADLSWNVEWRDGPYAEEMVTFLAEQLHDPGTGESLVEPVEPQTRDTGRFLAMGVAFELRAVDPAGREGGRSQPALWRMSAALDTTRRPAARLPWEELLGG
ncbi:hypothetical protein ACFFOP_31225 [Sinosporangium siamense]|uniref:hypothetical protein n=1 Tax=Sinosporangium siamense TaxID=1367973 RepID=UPI0035F03FB6